MTADEYAAGPARILAEDGPLLHVGFGDEDTRHSRAVAENIEVAEMIADDHSVCVGGVPWTSRWT